LNLSVRQSRDLLIDWVEAGWLDMTSASRKSRAYQLSAVYRRHNGDHESKMLDAWHKYAPDAVVQRV
jgi:hypothetical protein